MKLLLPAVLVLLAMTGCAGDDGQAKARQQLANRAGELKSAALAHDRAGAETALSSLHSEVADAVSEGNLDSEAAGEIMIAADRVAEDVRAVPGPTAGTVTIAPPTSGR